MSILKSFLEKHVLFHYVINAFLKALLVSILFFATVFMLLKVFGKYSAVESMLDLKHDSPWVIIPLLSAAALAALSFMIGMILYLYKYKRSNNKSEFYKALSGALDGRERDKLRAKKMKAFRVKKRILSIFVAALLCVNGFPLSVMAEFYEGRNPVRVRLEAGFAEKISVEDKEYDGGLTAKVHCENVKLVNADTAEEVSGGNVCLKADAEFEGRDASSDPQTVIVKNFRLEGTGRDDFILVGDYKEIEKTACITPKKLVVTPKEAWIYYGQKVPDRFDYSVQQPEGGSVDLNIKIAVEGEPKEIGDYHLAIVDQQPDNLNYLGILSESAKFSVKEYSPEEKDLLPDGVYDSDRVTLTAPEGFEISTDGKTFGSQVTVSIEETAAGQKKYVSYYLKNIRMGGAVSKELKHGYSCSRRGVVCAKIAKVESGSFLGHCPFGFVSNDNVKLIITVKGTKTDQETKICLNGEDGYQEVRLAQVSGKKNGIYYYTAEFPINVPDGKCFRSTFQARVTNEAGNSATEDVEMEWGNKSSQVLILDKLPPKVESMQITYHNKEGYVEAKGTIRDRESGVNKIEYLWNVMESNEFVEHGINDKGEIAYTKEPDGEIHFSVKLHYRDAPMDKYPYAVKLRITDNAGNINEGLQEYSNSENGRDTVPPKVQVKGFRRKGSKEFDDCVLFLEFGNYAKEDVELVVEAEDFSETQYVSGIQNVALCDGDNVITVLKRASADNEFVFVIPQNTKMDNMVIKAVDCGGIETKINVNDQVPQMKMNTLIVENDPPKVLFDTVESSATEEIGAEKVYWYNKDGGVLTVTVNDDGSENGACSGISSVLITDEHDGVCDTLYDESFTKGQTNSKAYSIDTSTLSDGIHYVKVEVVDNLGNDCIPRPAVRVIGVDRERPEGAISIEGPEAKEIDGSKWFDKDETITFRVDAKPDVSGIDTITLLINGKERTFTRDEVQSAENGCFVTVDTSGISYDQGTRHKYVVTGNIIDVAGNAASIGLCTAHVDCEPPSIRKLTVEKEGPALDKVLNVLSFGAYSNDSLIVKAHVSDAEFDSGIQCVEITYDGLGAGKSMTDEGNGVYSWRISNEVEVFQSDVIITAHDKYGKTSVICPNIESAEPGKGISGNVFVMIETEEPEVVISRPKGDGIVRDDGQTWFNSNKDVIISIYDKDSGIRNVDVKINGIDVTADKNGENVPKESATETAGERDTGSHVFTFDTDYFTETAGEPEDGKYMITVDAADNAGNVDSEESFTYYIDKTAPNIDSFEFLPETSDNVGETSEYIEHLEYGYYFKKDFTAKVQISDQEPSSGLNKVEYRLVSYDDGEVKGEKTEEALISDGMVSIDIPAGFKGQIFVRAFDNVGNQSNEVTPKAFVVDNVPPEITISEIGDSRYRDANGNKLFTEDLTMTVTISDTKSGIREIGYRQTSENGGFDRRVIEIDEAGSEVGAELGDGWIVTNRDANLVTGVTKTFRYDKDDNDVALIFDVTDNSGNGNKNFQSEMFTIDKTDPVINVDINSGVNDSNYYNAENRAVITVDVIERNFDPSLIQVAIENTYNGNVPDILFQDLSATEHRATIVFAEGDYTFGIRGADRGGRPAKVNLDHEKVRRFFVDETPPAVKENFCDFIKGDRDNYFNTEKVAVIKITEHNFDPKLVGLKILRKDAGMEHAESEFTDVTYSMVSMADWTEDNDTHTLSVPFGDDAVYRIEISPSDPAGNATAYRSSEIFEIDTTPPVVSAKNGRFVEEENAVEFLDVYPFGRKDEAAPTVEFTDVNFDHVKYALTVYAPEYTNGRELMEVKPVSVYLDSDKDKSGTSEENLFTLPDFTKDGVYALELIAVDKAGNESVLNSNTYMRIVESDVLAYIANSNAAEKTGWYSFQYENGEPMSKRPDNFSDIDIAVLAKKDSQIDIVLRDYNGDEKDTNLQAEADDSMFGVSVYRYTLKSDYFKDHFQEDTDVELHLSVKNESRRIDLGKLHIDIVPPSCTLPPELKSWNWYFGDELRTITITDISELLDKSRCKVYDNGKEIDFTYSETDGSLSFALNGGWHNVGITLEDMAGNVYSIQEMDNIHVGYFWLWVIIMGSVTLLGTTLLVILIARKRRCG